MSHTLPLIAVEPENELRFKGPFSDPSTATMIISNKTEKRVWFQVQTTAPGKYGVKPSNGVLEANSTVTVLVSQLPFDINDPKEKKKHKFQVLSAAVPEKRIKLDNVIFFEIPREDIHIWRLTSISDLPLHVEDREGSAEAENKSLASISHQLQSQATPTGVQELCHFFEALVQEKNKEIETYKKKLAAPAKNGAAAEDEDDEEEEEDDE